MTSAPIAPLGAAADLDALLRRWAAPALQSGPLVALEGGPAEGGARWLLRLRGEEKEFITLWLTLRQRTVHIEVQVMPAPEENREAVYRYLLVRNAELAPLTVALGPEDAIYLVGRMPVGEVDDSALDHLCGAALRYVDELYPTAMSLGMATWYRRRRRGS